MSLPQAKLLEYLKAVKNNDNKSNETPGLDCAVVKSKIPGYYSISTTDFFYPLIDDPYLQGRIAACNVISDMYAMGVIEIDTMLMILGVCREMPEKERDYSTREMIRGFNDIAHIAATNVTGGQTVMNEWPMIGGVATSISKEPKIKGLPCDYDGSIPNEDEEGDFIWPDRGEAGDVLILTKPIGTQAAVNTFEWIRKPASWANIEDIMTYDDIIKTYKMACDSMSFPNLIGAQLMRKYHAHGCTDITGFGIYGHTNNLAEQQRNKINLIIKRLPVIVNMLTVNDYLHDKFRFHTGLSAESSGGLMIMLPPQYAESYLKEYKELTGHEAWIVGEVVEGENKSILDKDMELFEVEEW
ncbi:hypothetical protein WA158_008359 [Blastocystis sp. Blastoise]